MNDRRETFMKKSREKDIVLNAIHNAGIEITLEISNAVSDGLRQIRREKFGERAKKKSTNATAHRTPGHKQSPRMGAGR